MNIIESVQIKRVCDSDELSLPLPLPYYASTNCSGMDLLAANKEDIILEPGDIKLIPTGICIALPPTFEAQIRPRSGLAIKHGITVLNTPGTIDEDYRGEIKVILINHGKLSFTVTHGLRIAQMVISKYYKISEWKETMELSETDRNSGGFGSTGV